MTEFPSEQQHQSSKSPEAKEPETKIGELWTPTQIAEKIEIESPELLEKLSKLAKGQVLDLDEKEKKVFADLVMSETPKISTFITHIARFVWGASSAEWQDPKNRQRRRENIAAAFWWDFCSSNLERNRVNDLVDFYLGTTKEEAEAQASERHGCPIKLS